MPENKKIRVNLPSESEEEADEMNPEFADEEQLQVPEQQEPKEEDPSGPKSATVPAEGQSETVQEMEEKLEKLEEEVKANYDRYLRVSADFENYKKRTAREMADLRKFANEALLKDLLSVVDNLERAIESGLKEDTNRHGLLEGVRMTQQEILRILEKYGVKPFDSVGKTFDPVYHQAMMQEERGDQPENTVTNELQKGYTIHGRLLRPAMVVVAKSPAEGEQ